MWVFYIFWLSKICFSLTDIVSSLSPPQCCLSSDRSHHDAAPCGTSFPWSQNELAASTSSFGNASSHCLPSRAKIEVLNLHHRGSHPPQTGRLLPSSAIKMSSQPFHSPTTQQRLHFASSLARAPRHRSSTHHRRSLSPSSHAFRPSTQRHPQWWTSRPYFNSQTTYRHVNSHKYKIF
jgi:hypothetical protein